MGQNQGHIAGKEKNRFGELDALRGLAALAVMLYHFTISFGHYYGADFGWTVAPFTDPDGVREKLGVVPVALFFIISGYVILMSVERAGSLAAFLFHRVARLYPVFWAAVLISVLVGLMFPLPGRDFTTLQVAQNLTMMPASFKAEMVDGVYWSLGYELRFYVILGLICALGAMRFLPAICIGWTGLQVLYGLMRLAGMETGDAFVAANVPYAGFFIAGICLYRMACPPANAWRGWPVLLYASFAVNFLCFAPWFAAATGLFLPLYLAAIHGRLKWLAVGPLLWLGHISYALYLIHMMVGFTLIWYLMQAGVSYLPGMIIAMAAMIALAALLTSAIEQPAQRRLRHWWHRREQAPAPASARQPTS